MATYQLIHASDAALIAGKIVRADSLLTKGLGLLPRSSLEPGEGLWLPGVSSVHTLGMRFAIDIVFLDARRACAAWHENVRPGRVVVGPRGTVDTIELAAGTLVRYGLLRFGDALLIKDA